MSNSLAIAAVTATLKNLLGAVSKDVFGAEVTTLAPDKALEGTGNRVNLFLYQTTVNTAFSNMDMPRQVKPGELGHPPLALNLHYLLTAYAEDDNDLEYAGHRLLGQAMSILHDHPVLDCQVIRDALDGNDLHQQVERVRVTPQPLSLDEMSKLWTTFQTQYRISAAYQVSVVLIESTRAAKTPLPVLRRGPRDEGVITQPDTTPPLPPFPTIVAVEPQAQQPSAELGTVLTIRGHNLEGDEVSLRFAHPRLKEPFTITNSIEMRTATEIRVKLSDPAAPEPDAEPWPGPPGPYTVAALITQDGKLHTTNELPFSLAPKITEIEVVREDGDVVITLTFTPEVLQKQNEEVLHWQRVSLLLGDREAPLVHKEEPSEVRTDTLEFRVRDVTAGPYFVRLRVDGIDSLLIKYPEDGAPLFDEDSKVEIP